MIPNILSLSRFPLALCFLSKNVVFRTLALIFAMFSDLFDGFIARRYKQQTSIGTILDPLSDKFFVFFTLTLFIQEERLSIFNAIFLLCRDFSVIFFGLYLILTKQWAQCRFRAFWCGKITTTFQFVVLLFLTLGFAIPSFLYLLFPILGILAHFELALTDNTHYPSILK